jgi:DNA-binding response OmpR family regulator
VTVLAWAREAFAPDLRGVADRAALGHASFVAEEDCFSYGVGMLFGKRKRIVNRILIVEDEPLTAFDNEVMLGDAGYEVVATIDRFADAIEKLNDEQVDLILSDVRLRGERSGIDLAQVALNRGVPILFVTGFPPENAAELAVGCLLKPYNERKLKAALEAVDRHLAGEKAKPPKGLELYPVEKA